MVKVYLFLLRLAFVIDGTKFRIRAHLYNCHNQDEMIAFLSDAAGISKNQFSIYNKPNTEINKKPGYKSACQFFTKIVEYSKRFLLKQGEWKNYLILRD